MKDFKYVVGFVVLGLALAYGFSGPLRNPVQPNARPTVQKKYPIYAQGTLSVSPALAGKAKNVAALYIIAKSVDGGPPVAVHKYDFPTLPLEFSLTSEDNMLGSTEYFDGDLKIIARLDKDGQVGPAQPGDLETSFSIKSGDSRNVTLEIKH